MMCFPPDSHDILAIVRIEASLDFTNADRYRKQWLEKTAAGARYFILDFSETGILDSTGLGAIFSLYKRVAPLGGKVAFAAPSIPVRIVVQISGIYKAFPIYASVEAAQEALEALAVPC